MKRQIFILFLLAPFFVIGQQIVKPEKAEPEKVVDDYHGIKVEDPYRYMENLDDPEVINWMKANTNYAEAVLDAIPGKQEMIKKIKEMDSRTASRVNNLNITSNDLYYYLKTRPEDQTGKLYFRKGYEGQESLLLDPDKYKADSGKTYTISSVNPDRMGNKVGVILAPDGSENGELVVLDQSGKQMGETLELVEGMYWTADENSLYYLKLNSPDISDMQRQLNLKVYEHKLGTSQSEDKEVLSSAHNPELNIKPEEIPILMYDKEMDLNFGIIVTVDRAIKLYMNNKDLSGEWKQLTAPKDKVKDFRANSSHIYYLTFKDAPNFKIMKASKSDPAFSNAQLAVAEPDLGPIDDFSLTEDGIFYTVKTNGVETRFFYKSFDNDVAREIKLPKTAGSAYMESKGPSHDDIWVTITGWTTPGKRYKYNVDSNEFIDQPMSSEAEYPELEDLVVKEIMVKSHDGVEVPVSIIHNKNVKLDGSNPTTMYSYGSYGISTGPFFSPLLLVHTLYGGIFVVPHVRGGGELGDAWHRAGQKANKPNTWKDAIATAEYLVDKGYTKPEKLSFFGGSAGGILVGRAVTERPDLFSAVAPLVGAMNTVRMEESPNGPVNAPEFGTVKDEEEFKALLEMDSYHHLKEGTEYPAMLITSGMNDPRVIAWEPAKFAAKAQMVNTSDEPILLLTDFDSGHGIGDTKEENFEKFANIFSFFFWQAGHPKFQPPADLID
ncbi:prolyl oligopeptidase family serine peptidase [Pontixanthobacter gangjinensis]|uniref:prolyl oligopeptidase n=1 Tax=Christiangramia aestuarii TaxID=1028746 RepID=A0A7K1LPW7_9FLAO|nr:prolyl oligopeptidase family serine peptidase [Christiangramia aestuarii]MUP42691.1 S9 family peptidase [Christiangramia aestuarii]